MKTNLRTFLLLCGCFVFSIFSSAQTITYSESFTAGAPASAAAIAAWNAFTAQLVPGNNYTSVEISGTFDAAGRITNDPVIASAMANALFTQTDYISPLTNGNVWSLCDRYLGEVWLNPPNLCSGSNCPSPGYIIRPGISSVFPGNTNWGGVNTQTCGAPSQTMTMVFTFGAPPPPPPGNCDPGALLSVARGDNLLRTINPANAATTGSVPITLAGFAVFGGNGLATHPITGDLYAVIRYSGGNRALVTLDPNTGVATIVGTLDDESFAGIAFDCDGTLYGDTGDGSNTPSSLFTISTVDATPTFVCTLGHGDDGEALGYNPDDDLLYHASGHTGDWDGAGDGVVFETISNSGSDPCGVTNIDISGTVLTDEEAQALTWDVANGAFLWKQDHGTGPLYSVTTAGAATFIGDMDHQAKGLAFSVACCAVPPPPMCDAPTVVCPPDMTVECEDDIVVNANDAVGTPDVANGCTIVGQWVDQPHITGARDCDGTTYEYTYHVVDDQGNIGSCIQTWTLENDPPTITVIPGTTVDCFDDIVVDPSDATVTTSCGEILDVTIYSPVITGDANCPGTTYTFTYRVEDQCEREATVDRVFTIGGTGGLSIIPPANYTCECIAAANPGNATVSSTCGGDAVVTVTGPVLSNFPLPNCPGSTATYTYTATACGVSVSAQQVITIQNEGPVFDNCPENCLIINCEDEGYEDVIQAWLNSVTASGSCGVGVTVTNNYNPNTQGTCINNGTTTVTWTARDVCNRTTQCQSMIIINDTEPPIFLEEAKDELDICNYNTVHEFDAWVANRGGAIAWDCDDNITPNQWSTIPNNPSISCIGQMGATSVTVTFVVRDDCGNKSSSTATFTALMAGGDFADQGGDAEAANDLGFALNQNQPNPFRNETVISFNLPESAAATLTIYDVSGKVVKVVQGDYAEGYNEIQINRSELSGAGLLYYELSTANETAVRKMIIID